MARSFDRMMRTGSFEMGERPDRELGAKRDTSGIKVLSTEIVREEGKRYVFRMEASAPKRVRVGDLATMLEARFAGEKGMDLRLSRDEAVQRLKERMEKRLEKTKLLEERAAEQAKLAEERRAEYEKTKDEIRTEALGDIEVERKRVQQQVDEARARQRELEDEIDRLNDEKDGLEKSAADRRAMMESAQDRILQGMQTNVMDEPYLPAEQAQEMAENLVDTWRSDLQDYGNPMASEYDDLSVLLAKLISKTVGRVNDRWRDSGRTSAEEPVKVAPAAGIKKGDAGLF